MGNVKEETKQKVAEYVQNISPDLKDKCSMCNSTLTHITKTGEVATGAPQATVTAELAKQFNKTAAEGDKVTPRALNDRVERQVKVIFADHENKTTPKTNAILEQHEKKEAEKRSKEQEAARKAADEKEEKRKAATEKGKATRQAKTDKEQKEREAAEDQAKQKWEALSDEEKKAYIMNRKMESFTDEEDWKAQSFAKQMVEYLPEDFIRDTMFPAFLKSVCEESQGHWEVVQWLDELCKECGVTLEVKK